MTRALPRLFVLMIVCLFATSSWAEEAFWIDVRSADEYRAGHVAQAVNIPHTEISSRTDELPVAKDGLIYVYCRSGRRSGLAQESLEQAGYTNVVNLGGLEDALKKASGLATP